MIAQRIFTDIYRVTLYFLGEQPALLLASPSRVIDLEEINILVQWPGFELETFRLRDRIAAPAPSIHLPI